MESFTSIPEPPKTGAGFGQPTNPFSNTNGSFRPNFGPNFDPNFFRTQSNNTNQAPVLLGVGGALLFLSICLLAARLWSRLRPINVLALDDVTVFFATLLALIQYLILSAAVLHGLGRRAIFVPAPGRSSALRLLFISQLFWYWSITLVKVSVALLLLRLKSTLPWRVSLHLIIAIALIAAIVQTVFQFLQCRPFTVYWDPRVFRSAQCFRRSIINGNIIVFSSIQVVLDLIFTILPIFFVRKLRRPRREKIFICVLMGLGVFAASAAVVRTLSLQDYYTTPDLFRTNVSISMWAILEQQFALMAATMPTLKAVVERMLVRLGEWVYEEESEERVRGELVKMGLLNEGDTLIEEEVVRKKHTVEGVEDTHEGAEKDLEEDEEELMHEQRVEEKEISLV